MNRLNPNLTSRGQDKATTRVGGTHRAPGVAAGRAGVIVGVALAAALTGLAPTAAVAQVACAERNQLIERLEKIHSEKRRAIALSASGGVLEVFTSPTGGWTILLTQPNGRTCVVALGEAWENLRIVASGPAA